MMDRAPGRASAKIGRLHMENDAFLQSEITRLENELAEKNGIIDLLENTAGAVLRSSAGGIIVIDDRGVIVEANESFGMITGVSRKDAIGKPIDELLSVYGENRVFADVVRSAVSLVRGKEGGAGEIRVCGRSIELYASVASGKRRISAVFLRDVTEERCTATELVRTTTLLEQAFEQSPVPMVLVSMPGAIVRIVNPACREFLGIEDEQSYIGTSLFDFVPSYKDLGPDGGVDSVDTLPLARALGGEKTLNEERCVIRKDGTARWELASGVPIRNADGDIIAGYLVMTDITERKNADKALSDAEVKIRTVFDSSSDGILLARTRDRAFTMANKRICEILGYTEDELLSMDISGIHPQESLRFVSEQFDRLLNQEIRIAKDVPVKKRNGSVFYADVTASPITLAGELHLLGVFRDVTELKRAEEAVRISEDRFKRLFMSMNDGFYLSEVLYDEKGNVSDYMYLEVNPAFEKMIGLGRDRIIGRTYREVVPVDTTKWFDAYKKVAITGEPVTYYFYSAEYKKHFETYSYKPSKNQVTVIVRDVSERMRAEEKLASEKERLAVTLRCIGDGVITTDTEGRIVTLNKVAETLTGFRNEEASGRPLLEVFNIVDERTRRQCDDPVRVVLRTGSSVSIPDHAYLVSKSGSGIVVADSCAPIRDNESRIIGVVIVFRDMTERHKLDASLQRAQRLESLGILAGGIAHDFNNLLGGIFGFLYLIDNRVRASDYGSVPEYIREALSVFDRARALTRQLITFSRGGEPIRKNVQLSSIIRKSAQFALSGSNVSARFDMAEDLWTCDCDENQIEQVIDNIVINAKQAMPTGGVIDVSAKNVASNTDSQAGSLQRGKYVRITIRDRGIGMSKEIVSKIFDPFFSTKQTGHGLGLATVFSIVQRHDGRIDVESELNEGSAFHVYLPASEGAIQESRENAIVMHTGSGTVLVMDDEDFMQKILAEMIEIMGYTTLKAKSGEEALGLITEAEASGESIRAFILDLTIPGGMGGAALLERIREIKPDAIVIATSGYSNDPVMAKPSDHGFTDKLVKPFGFAELSSLFERIFPRESRH